MGLYQIFKDAAYERMTRHGFIHQSNVFIRILGGEIVQAVTVKPITSYDVTAAIFPLCQPPVDLFWEGKKPYFAEQYTVEFDYSKFPYVICSQDYQSERKYYSVEPFLGKRQEYVDYTIKNLEKAAEQIEENFIPILDKICDIDSYLDWMQNGCEGVRHSWWLESPILLHKSCLDGDFEWGNRYVEKYLGTKYEKDLSSLFKSYKILPVSDDIWKNDPSFAIIKEEMARRDEIYFHRFKNFYEYRDKNDIDGAKTFIEAQRERTLDTLRKKYSKLKL